MKFLFIVSFVMMYACGLNTSSPENNFKQVAKMDTLVKEIPRSNSGDFAFFYRNVKAKTGELKLYSLENGRDQLEIRIWCFYMSSRAQLLTFKQEAAGWSGTLCEFNISNKKLDESTQNLACTSISPKSGWAKLMSTIDELNIIHLPQSTSGGNDGVRFTVEIASKNLYRIYSYWCPDTEVANDQNAGNLNKFLSLLEQEFDFRRISDCQ